MNKDIMMKCATPLKMLVELTLKNKKYLQKTYRII